MAGPTLDHPWTIPGALPDRRAAAGRQTPLTPCTVAAELSAGWLLTADPASSAPLTSALAIATAAAATFEASQECLLRAA